jgi:N-acetyl-beta-hexosaminidase
MWYLHSSFLSLLTFLVVYFCYNWNVVLAASVRLSPQPKQIDLIGSPVDIRGAYLLVNDDVRTQFMAAVRAIEQHLGQKGEGIPIRVQTLSQAEATLLAPDVRMVLGRREAYWLEVKKDALRIVGADALGVLHGLTTLEQLLRIGTGTIPQGRILDWPDHKLRGLHIVLGSIKHRDPMLSTVMVRRLIDQARQGRYNVLILQLANSVRLRSMARLVSERAWTIDEFLAVVRYARENGLEVIPEVRLLTHQEKLLRNVYPDLMYNKSTYDPRRQEVYEIVLPILDEVIDLIRPTALHIGHDEVAGRLPIKKSTKRLNPGDAMLPPELFLEDVKRLHAHLQKRGVETWMWGDMLLAPEEFPSMLAKELHGTHGYAALRSKIPQDIVICDWHYFDSQPDFPSALTFMQRGHRVLGNTWTSEITIRNFSQYVARIGGEGMIATLWQEVRRSDMSFIERIIQTSGEAFWNTQ